MSKETKKNKEKSKTKTLKKETNKISVKSSVKDSVKSSIKSSIKSSEKNSEKSAGISTNKENQYDVLIIGGGMIGASMACALGSLNNSPSENKSSRNQALRIAIIEAFPFRSNNQPSYDARSIALAYGSKRIFETLNVWDSIKTDANPIEHIHVSNKGQFGVTRINAADERLDALGYVVENRIIGNALLSRISQYDNIDLICPANLETLEINDESASITISQNDKPQILKAKLIIGADGGNSKVRELLSIQSTNKDYQQTAIISNVTSGKPHKNIAYERFTQQGPIAILPMTENRCSLVLTVNSDQTESVLSMDDQTFLAYLEERFGYRTGGFTKTSKRFSYPLSLMKIKEHYKSRAVIIGNAAHTLHPIAGQGFNLGLRDVSSLAEVIANALKNGQDIGDASVLNKYQQQREKDQHKVALITDSLANIFSNEFYPLAKARSKGLLLADLFPGAKHILAKEAMGISGKLPRLSRGLPL